MRKGAGKKNRGRLVLPYPYLTCGFVSHGARERDALPPANILSSLLSFRIPSFRVPSLFALLAIL